MKKIFSILFALVLVASFSLVTAVPVVAQVAGVELETWNEATAEWSTAENYSGDYSVKLEVQFDGNRGDKLYQGDKYGEEGAIISIAHPTMAIADLTEFTFQFLMTEGIESPRTAILLDSGVWLVTNSYDYNAAADWDDVAGKHVAPDTWQLHDEWNVNVMVWSTDPTVITDLALTPKVETGEWYRPDEGMRPLDQLLGIGLVGDIIKYEIRLDGVDKDVVAGTYAEGNPVTCDAFVDDAIINSVLYELEWTHVSLIEVDDDREQFPGAPFQTIQGAIDCAIAEDTIQVYAGEYNEQVVISTANLTVESVSGKATTTIDGTGLPYTGLSGRTALVRLEKDGITFRGFTVQNFPSAWTPTYGEMIAIWGWDGSSYVEDISNCLVTENIISETPEDCYGISMGYGADENTISVNEISDSGHFGIFVRSDLECVHNIITGNTITNSDGYGIQVITGTFGIPADFPGTVISDNEISGGTHGIGITYSVGTEASPIVIEDNYIHEVITDEGEGIEVYYGGYVDIFRNTVQGNTTGIQVKYSADIVTNYNDISGNTDGFEAVDNTVDVDATKNWWGHTAGPEITTNPYNAEAVIAGADTCTTGVDYIPWMIHTELAEGWNVYSTPIAPDASSDTIGKALDLWTVESGNLGLSYYYGYDSVAEAQAWISADADTALTPLQAVYLNMTAAATIDVVFSTSYSATPSETMYAGWNLIGLAELYDMSAEGALASAYYVAGANNIGYSQVVSSPLGQTAWSAMRGATIDATTGEIMAPCEGYWLLMVNQGTLGGFTSTPIAEVLP